MVTNPFTVEGFTWNCCTYEYIGKSALLFTETILEMLMVKILEQLAPSKIDSREYSLKNKIQKFFCRERVNCKKKIK